MTDPVYEKLCAPFDIVKTVPGPGGVQLAYLSIEQVTTRLNDVLGPFNWSFSVDDHRYNEEADEVWCKGTLTVIVDGQTVSRQQFGSQKINRRRDNGKPVEIGFDLKGAASDCLKKCAQGFGVGLYLSAQKAEPTVRRYA